MIEKWKESVDNGQSVDNVVTNISKTFGCLHNGILLRERDVHGFGIKLVQLIQQCLSNRR